MRSPFTKMLALLFLLLSSANIFAQSQTPLNIALAEVNRQHAEWSLTDSDINDMYVSDLTFDKKTEISRVYFQQRHAGIKVNKAILNVSIDKNGEVFFVGKRFIPALNTKINTSIPAIDAEQALRSALLSLGVTPANPLSIKAQEGNRKLIFDGAEFAKDDIIVELQYQSVSDETVRLAWDMVIDATKDSDRWSMRIDAVTGDVLDKENYTIYCAHAQDQYHNHDAHCREEKPRLGSVQQALQLQSTAATLLAEDNAQYRVFAIPTESPAHGAPVLIQNPAYLPASPYGWHDTDGVDGPEYTITRGNNTWAWEDRDDNQTTNNTEPDGGQDLIFDFTYSDDLEPEAMIPFATTNLFYMVNVMHDFAHAYGMDEQGGTFQENNYGNGGADGDPILALAQASADVGSSNNAFYSHANDGSSPNINMFIWNDAGGAKYLRVDAPASIEGTYDTGTADWGADITTENGVTGAVAIYNDNEFNPYATDACEDPVNAAALAGKIALIDRGGCEFGSKALRAENAGAIGVIICNFEDDLINMAAGQDGGSVTIPVVFIQNTDCATIRASVNDGLEVTLIAPEQTGPNQLDGDLDNGIIAHEFGHGISLRLTCGPSSSGLGNAEQMGEGWSDFMSLVMSAKEGDTGEMRRGVGTFVQREPNDGRGIRRYPYSTDMSISPLTYGDVASNTGVHAIGEVWCNMIWDLYWAMVDEYGFDPDVYAGTGGNNMAIQLVFEGMKNQACSPGFIDGRDAILAADQALYNGDNQCLIWEVFARRGAGFNAMQGSPNNAADQIESFGSLPTCVKELKIAKEVTPLINPGDDIDVTLRIINHKDDAVTGVVVTDVIPAGTSYVAGSGSIAGTVNGNEVSFDLGDNLEFDTEFVLTYKLSTDPDIFSVTQYKTSFEADDDNAIWFADTFDEEDQTNSWTINNNEVNSGENSYFVANLAVETQDAIFRTQPILVDADNPVIRFFHNYDTEGGADAGLFEVTTDDDVLNAVWQNAGENAFRGTYPGFVQYGTFVVPNLSAFSGNSGGWIASYVDMSDYAGQEVYLRFRFGSDDNNSGDPNVTGWYLDDVELMDMENYISDVTISSAQGDMATATPDGRGTIVESQVVSSTFEVLNENLSVAVYPNPAKDFVHVRMNTTETTDVNITIYTVDGRILQTQQVTANGAIDVPINVTALTAGFYFVKIDADGSTYTEKIVIE